MLYVLLISSWKKKAKYCVRLAALKEIDDLASRLRIRAIRQEVSVSTVRKKVAAQGCIIFEKVCIRFENRAKAHGLISLINNFTPLRRYGSVIRYVYLSTRPL